MAAKFETTTLPDSELVPYLMEKLQVIANEAISSRGVFLLGVSGGSVINFLIEGLPKLTTDWKSWKIFLCDERLVPEDDPESTYGLYKAQLFPNIPEFPVENFLEANVGLGDREEVAKDYEIRLRNLWPISEINGASYGMADCLILGVGPDGHTCSLFPGHPGLQVVDSWVTSIEDSPKPPPKRITLTYPFLNKAAHILVVGKGEQKLEIAKKIQGGEDLPIGRVDNPGGLFEWIIGTGN